MSKRRRTSSVVRHHDDEDSNEASTSREPLRKRKKLFDPIEACHQLYETIRNHKKSDGTLLCDSFIRVPKRRQEPGYYDVVNNPIDLLKVQQKLKTDEYNDIHDLETDIELIVANTKAFYKKSTQEWKDADELWNLFLNSKSKILNPEDRREKSDIKNPNHTPKPVKTPIRRSNSTHKNNSKSTNNISNSDGFKFNDDPQQYEDLFNTVMTATDDNKTPLNKHFQLLPSKTEYPEYYEVIEQPIDLKRIAIKIQNNRYSNILALEKDLVVMCKNACLFNEPNSLIYNHAKHLKKIVNQRRIEIMDQYNKPKASPPVNKSITPKRNRNYLALMAKLRNPEGSSDSENESESEPETPVRSTRPRTPAPKARKEEARSTRSVQNHHHVQDDFVNLEPENPQWKLLETVWRMQGSDNSPLSEPFWKLPSRRIYPDYYREIKNPMSLTQIRNKLTKKLYGTVSEVAGDMTVMFENAKKYNVPNSKLYKDAVKLQKVMQAKVQALLDIDQKLDDSSSHQNDEEKKKIGSKPKNLSPMGLPMRGRPPKEIIPMKRRLYSLAKYMLDFTCEDGRQPMLAFMEKPSKKLYPEYYEVIEEPIDFLEIESKIKAEQYSCEKDLVADFQLMFSNCRQFNEENSPIYEDANLLEKHLMDKVGPMFNTPEKHEVKKEKHTVRVYKPRKILTPLEKGLKQMYEAVRDYRDSKGRQLSQIFQKLPSRVEYPDYYEVIKHPIDMERIAHKMKNNFYEFVEDMAADFTLMLDNACKFNEPDSQIYKDALVLQRIVSQKRLQLKELAEDEAPDVAEAVQDILLTLFTTIYNHQDDEGRCYSDSMAELPEHDEIDGKKCRALSLDLIKRRLDKNLYKRLDLFQSDFFACMDRARRLSRSDSQVFEDAVEMQMFFIKMRDELCKQGELLQSPALTYTALDARHVIEKLRHQKSMQESLEEDTETRSSDDSVLKDGSTNGSIEETMTCNHKTFQVGEFVYMDAKKEGCEPHIIKIEKLFEKNGQQMLYGNHYLRPDETYHVQTRRFLEKEVFKSDQYATVPLEEIRDRCCVLSAKQYFTMRPEGHDDSDVYVSEFRYSSRNRAFKKIKIFPELPSSYALVNREVPLEPKRVMSVFKERLEKHKDELAELQVLEGMIDDDRPNVVAFVATDLDDGNTYYEQYNTICSGVIKTGDFVYVVVDGGRQVIAQIDCIWDTTDGKCYFRGPWFLCPTEVPNPTNKLYYKNEVLLSTDEDINPIVSIIGRCSVLDYNDYVSLRPTEVPEQDVYICTSIYDEISRQIRKLPPEGLRKYYHLPDVVEDELYYFSKLLNPSRVDASDLYNAKLSLKVSEPNSTKEASPTLSKLADIDIVMEDSLDGGPPSVGSGEIPAAVNSILVNPISTVQTVTISSNSVSTPTVATPTPSSTKKKSNKSKVVTGYILYSREVRKQVVQNNPESKFGDISRIVGSEWKALGTSEKQVWEERASKLNEETKAQLLAEQESCPSPAPLQLGPPENQIFECKWEDCDFQFEELSDCVEHSVKDSKDSQGHVQKYYQEHPGEELQCKWRNCSRLTKKNLQPFPNITRLIRHVRDMHINKGNGRVVMPDFRSKNFKPSTKAAAARNMNAQAATSGASVATPGKPPASSVTPVVAGAAQKSTEPMFLSVPPRPQRVLHSEAYIKYIEGLNAEQKHISNWERTLHATPETCTPPDPEKLSQVATWLGKRADQHDNVVAALWQLRNQLLKDTLCLHKTL